MSSKVLTGCLLAAALCAPAAADAQQAYDWTGFYIGLHGGAATGQADVDSSLSGEACIIILGCADFDQDASDTHNVNGLFGGGQLGVDYAMGKVLVGLQGDFSGSGIDGDGNSFALADIPGRGRLSGFLASGSASTDIDWLATVRGRLGVIGPGDSLLYVTGGLAMADVKTSFDYALAGGIADSGSFSDEETRFGWTAGIGAAAPVSKRVNIGLEYLFTDLGSGNSGDSSGSLGIPPIANVDYNVGAENSDLYIHSWRASVNIKLGGRN